MNTKFRLNGLKILGVFFVLNSLLGFITFYLLFKKINIQYYVYPALNSLMFFIAGIGILKLKPWARILALVVCTIKTIQVASGSIKDIGIMIKVSAGFIAISFGVVITITIIASGIWIVYYLNRPGIKAEFNNK